MEYFGKDLFDIMAGHFVALKLVDIIYALLIHELDVQVYGVFPVAYSRVLWPVYIVAGLCLPCVVAQIVGMIKKKLLDSHQG